MPKQQSKNFLLKSAIISIMNDGIEKDIKTIKFLLEINNNLIEGDDYQYSHFNNAIALLKKEGFLSSVGRGKFVKCTEAKEETSLFERDDAEGIEESQETSDNEGNGESMNLVTNSKEANNIVWKLMNRHYQECVSTLKNYDLTRTQPEDLKEIAELINYKNALEDKMKSYRTN